MSTNGEWMLADSTNNAWKLFNTVGGTWRVISLVGGPRQASHDIQILDWLWSPSPAQRTGSWDQNHACLSYVCLAIVW